MIQSIRMAALGGTAILAMLLTGCAVDGPGPVYGAGVGYRGYGAYDGPYYGGYGPYYGDTIVIGDGYRHRGYYGSHHVYGGGYRGGNGGRFSGSRNFVGPRQTAVRSGGGGRGGGHGGGHR